MKYKTLTLYFAALSFVLTAPIPIFNLPTAVAAKDITLLFNTDKPEKWLNYYAYKTFGISLEPDSVIAGDDSFLFLGNREDDVISKYNGKFRPDIRQLDLWIKDVSRLLEWYKQRDISVIMAIAPNKHSIYSERLPAWLSYGGNTITDDIITLASENKLPVLDLRPLIRTESKDKLLYYKTDTHWNNLGAAIAYSETLRFLNSWYGLNLPVLEYTVSEGARGGGDLARLLKISDILPKDYDKYLEYRIPSTASCMATIDLKSLEKNECEMTENSTVDVHDGSWESYNSDAPGRQKVLLLCDSFCAANSSLYNANFETVWSFHHGRLYGKKLERFVNENHPDIVIYQLVERVLYNSKIVRDIPTS